MCNIDTIKKNGLGTQRVRAVILDSERKSKKIRFICAYR